MSLGLTTPLRDVISVPEEVHADAFVLQLVRGVAAPEATIKDYVVTPAIAGAVDEALDKVQVALRDGTSKGTFIHGSFGSGKSHFMAVLHLLLTGTSSARALRGLQDVVKRREQVLGGNFLAVDYHFVGKASFESALFAGYLDAVRAKHPESPEPVLHKSDGILADAEGLRQRLGDESFFAALGGSSADAGSTGGRWGTQSASFTRETYDAARAQNVDAPERQRLVRELVGTFFGAAVSAHEWLETSQGLRAMTEHAKSLGYDGLVLFLDELVLWLGQHLGDADFIKRETEKVAKLVETEMAVLPLPLVSFVARQRELKDFLGNGVDGAERMSLSDAFQWWEGRFDQIVLPATDLPEIVQRRLLAPSSTAGAAALASAVNRVKANPEAWRYLLEDEARADEGAFAKVYPFSPALVDAMVALSTLMQRERTALKIMSELLWRGRDELLVQDVIPVGDLFDIVVLGDSKPLTEFMQKRFADAATFYERKMRPYLLEKYSLTDAEAQRLPRSAPFRTEDRLAKTLLVAELAPDAVSLRSLTASKLAALNFGTIVSFVPGAESQQVLTWVRDWTREFGEVNVGQGPDPVISIQLAGVDYDSVLDRVRNEDNPNTKRTLLKEILLEELGVTTSGGLMSDSVYRYVWRGSRREVDLVFGNVRDQKSFTDQALYANPGRWKVAIDFPFDQDPTHGPNDDTARIETMNDAGKDSETIVWAPHFLAMARMEDVGKLVLLEYVLNGNRFDDNSKHLPVGDREPARIMLENHRTSLRQRVRDVLREAYAITTFSEENIGQAVTSGGNFATLATGLEIRTPSATTLRGGLDHVLSQAFEFQYPEHPRFVPGEVEVTRAHLASTLELVRAAASGGGRFEGVDRARRAPVGRIIDALRLGTLNENVYAVGSGTFGWWDRFTRWDSEADGATVADLRERLSDYGMAADVEDLLILSWATLADRQWFRYGAPVPSPGIGQAAGDMHAREPHLPEDGVWRVAVERAGAVFDVAREHHRNTGSVQRLAAKVRAAATEARGGTAELRAVLEMHAASLGLDGAAVTGRLATARRAHDLVEELVTTSDDTGLIEALAAFDLPAEPQPLARSIVSAGHVAAVVKGAQWDILDRLGSFGEDQGRPIREKLYAAAAAEEMHRPLAPVLREVTRDLVGLMTSLTTSAAPQPGTGAGPVPLPREAASGAIVSPPASAAGQLDPVGLVIKNLDTQQVSLWKRIKDAYEKPVDGKKFYVRWGWE